MVERIEYGGQLFALVIRSDYEPKGVNFVTGPDSSLQLGVLVHDQGSQIKPHVHKPLSVQITTLQEVLHVQLGKVWARFYDTGGEEVGGTILNRGDTILLVSGGHGFDILEDCKIIEVKQGPYRGIEQDKERLQIKSAT